jgi:hypothetical protein
MIKDRRAEVPGYTLLPGPVLLGQLNRPPANRRFRSLKTMQLPAAGTEVSWTALLFL